MYNQLYNNIINSVAKIVKKSINESFFDDEEEIETELTIGKFLTKQDLDKPNILYVVDPKKYNLGDIIPMFDYIAKLNARDLKMYYTPYGYLQCKHIVEPKEIKQIILENIDKFLFSNMLSNDDTEDVYDTTIYVAIKILNTLSLDIFNNILNLFYTLYTRHSPGFVYINFNMVGDVYELFTLKGRSATSYKNYRKYMKMLDYKLTFNEFYEDELGDGSPETIKKVKFIHLHSCIANIPYTIKGNDIYFNLSSTDIYYSFSYTQFMNIINKSPYNLHFSGKCRTLELSTGASSVYSRKKCKTIPEINDFIKIFSKCSCDTLQLTGIYIMPHRFTKEIYDFDAKELYLRECVETAEVFNTPIYLSDFKHITNITGLQSKRAQKLILP